MRFRSELLQPPKEEPQPTLTTIYDVYMTPDGRPEGLGEDDLAASLSRLAVRTSKENPDKVSAFMQEFRSQTLTEKDGLRLWQGKVGFLLTEAFAEPNTIHVRVVWSFVREQGWGSKAMKWLCDLADKYGITLQLQARSMLKQTLDDEELHAWYGRFGFNGSSELMTRQPKTKLGMRPN